MCQDGSRLLSQVLLESKDRVISLTPGAATFTICIAFLITFTTFTFIIIFIAPSL